MGMKSNSKKSIAIEKAYKRRDDSLTDVTQNIETKLQASQDSLSVLKDSIRALRMYKMYK